MSTKHRSAAVMTPGARPDRADFNCRLCGSDGLRLYYTLGNDGRFRYYKCPACGLVNYDLSTGLDQGQYTNLVDPMDDGHRWNQHNDRAWDFLKRRVPGPGRLLDIGCGNGRLIYRAKRDGWQVKGLELSPEMAEFAAAKVGAEVIARDFLDGDVPAGDRESFDVVSLRHVLEHLPWPMQAMTKIRELLKPGGYLLIEVPNVESLSRRWVRLLVNTGLYRRRFDDDLMAGHCCEYSRRSFTALLERSRCRLEHWETYSRRPWSNFFWNHVPIGTKARALARRL
jgi:SAM-dependent methyltransferase